ncbi:cytosine permease [Vibrio variabilis]|uniref:cytosine permease n=1 Tax=Vibrio variabilis TaxID=990271 RepID=UPI000DD68ADB|nr:cytosine permease [Vibrio variabilis]
MANTQTTRKIDDFELEPVPEKAKRSWYVISLIWLAIGIDISGLFLGAFLSTGLTIHDALFATFAGSAVLAVLAMLCANIGFQSGVSTPLMSSSVFGRHGGKVLGAINGISLVGWFAFQADFFAYILVDALAQYDIVVSHFAALVGGGVLMMITAIYGVRALGKLSAYSVPLMVTLITVGLFMAAGAQSAGDKVIESPLSMGEAISYVMSIWILAAVAAPDIARYAKTRKDAILGAGFGFLFGNSATIVVALLLTQMTGSDDLVNVFFGIGLGMAAIIVLVFAQWTTNSSNLVSGALGMSVVLPNVPRPILVIIMTILGLAIAQLGMIDMFTAFLTLLGVTIAPSAGVYLAQYYFLDKSALEFERIQSAPNWMLKGLVAWALGSAVSACTAGEFFNLFSLTSISAIDGILASFVAYIVLVKLSVSNKEAVRDFQ